MNFNINVCYLNKMSESSGSAIENENIEPLKRKKGRPRKEKEIEEVDVEKKKRGRKKKEIGDEEVKTKKKRGRKAMIKFFSSSIRKQIPLSTSIYDNNHILHIDVSDDENNETFKINVDEQNLKIQEYPFVKDKLQELIENDKNILLDYIENENCDDKSLKELYETRIKNRNTQDKLLVDNLDIIHESTNFIEKITNTEKVKTHDNNTKKITNTTQDKSKTECFSLMTEFENKNWLLQTDICCHWDCHPIFPDNIPIGMPVQYVNNKFRVRGIFCSFACMLAYNEVYVKNKQNQLIKFMYKKLTGEFDINKRMVKAPSRFVLKMFGGALTIEEFRNSTKEGKIYKMVEYPMFISRDYIEEIDLSIVKNANSNIFDNKNETLFHKVIPLDNKKIIEAKTRVEKSGNSVKTIGNTLDTFINGN